MEGVHVVRVYFFFIYAFFLEIVELWHFGIQAVKYYSFHKMTFLHLRGHQL